MEYAAATWSLPVWPTGLLPFQMPKMLPTAKLALKMLLPSRGSNATCKQQQAVGAAAVGLLWSGMTHVTTLTLECCSLIVSHTQQSQNSTAVIVRRVQSAGYKQGMHNNPPPHLTAVSGVCNVTQQAPCQQSQCRADKNEAKAAAAAAALLLSEWG
jgi:hypothetical protein